MNFSRSVKAEVARELPTKQCCRQAAMAAVYAAGVTSPGSDDTITIDLADAAVARLVWELLERGKNGSVALEVVHSRGKSFSHYLLTVDGKVRYGKQGSVGDQDRKLVCAQKLQRAVRARCCARAFLRLWFLVRGSVVDPRHGYHLELSAPRLELAKALLAVLRRFSLKGHLTKRRRSYVIYLKDGEDIIDFLGLIGASQSLLDYADARTQKQMRGRVNRLVNCDTANLDKTVAAAMSQIADIEFIDRQEGLENLPLKLRELARCRLENPYANMRELGRLLSPPLGKSGVNYRMRRLHDIAEKLRSGKQDSLKDSDKAQAGG